jgi:hypothetical protein
MPIWASTSNKISLMSEWNPKLPLLLMKPKRKCNQFCGVPSWMLVLMNKMLEETGKGNLLEICQTSKFISMVREF